MKRRGKVVALATAAIGIIVLVVAAIAAKDRIHEKLLPLRARWAVQRGDWDRAVEIYGTLLKLTPSDADVQRSLESAKELRHVQRMNELIRKAMNDYDLAVITVEEGAPTFTPPQMRRD